MSDIPMWDAAQALIVDRFESSPEMWQDGYSFEVEYDQVDIFLENSSKIVMVFCDDHLKMRGKRAVDDQYAGSMRFEYANPEFDDLVIAEIKRRLNI